MEHIGTGLNLGEFTLIRFLYEEVSKREIKSFIKYEVTVGLDLTKLQRLGYIKIVNEIVFLRSKAVRMMMRIPSNAKNRAVILAPLFRVLFPGGKKAGIYYWRTSTTDITKKLIWFIRNYGSYTNDQILAATSRYVNSFGPLDRDNGMMLSKYFIEKNKASTLLDCLENSSDDEIQEVDNFKLI